MVVRYTSLLLPFLLLLCFHQIKGELRDDVQLPDPVVHDDISLSFEDLDHFSELGLLEPSIADFLKLLAETKYQATQQDENVTEALLLFNTNFLDSLENSKESSEPSSILWPIRESAISLASFFTLSNFLYLIGFGSVGLVLVLISSFTFALFGQRWGWLVVDLVTTMVLFFFLRPLLQEANRVFFLNIAYILYSIFHFIVTAPLLEISNEKNIWLNCIPTIVSLFTLSDFLEESVEGEAVGTKWAAWVFASLLFGAVVLIYSKPRDPENFFLVLKEEVLLPVPLALIPSVIVFFFLRPLSSFSQLTELHYLSLFPLVSLSVVCWPIGKVKRDFSYIGIISFFASIFAFWIKDIPFTLWFGSVTFVQVVFAAAVVCGLGNIILVSKRVARLLGLSEKWTARWNALFCIFSFIYMDVKEISSLGECVAEARDGSVCQINCFFLVYAFFIGYSLFRFAQDIRKVLKSPHGAQKFMVSWTKEPLDQVLFLCLWEVSVLALLSLLMFRGTNSSLLVDPSRGPILFGAFLTCSGCFLLMCTTSYFFSFVKTYVDPNGKEAPLQSDIQRKNKWWSFVLLVSVIFFTAFFRFVSCDNDFGGWFARTQFVQEIMLPELRNWEGVQQADDDAVMSLFVLVSLRYAWGFGLFLISVLTCKFAVAINQGFISMALISVATVPALVFTRIFFPEFSVPGLLALISLWLMLGCFPNRFDQANTLVFHGIFFMALGLFDYYFLSPTPSVMQNWDETLPLQTSFVYGKWWWLWLWDDPFRYQFHYYHSFYYWPFFSPFPGSWWVSPPLWSLSGDFWVLGTTLAGFSHLGFFSAPPFLCGLMSFHFGLGERFGGQNPLISSYFPVFCVGLLLLGAFCGSAVALLGAAWLLFMFTGRRDVVVCYTVTAFVVLFYENPSAFGIVTSFAFSLSLLNLAYLWAKDLGNKSRSCWYRSRSKPSFFSSLLQFPLRMSLIVCAIFLLHLGAVPHLSWSSLFSPFSASFSVLGFFPNFFFLAADILFAPFHFGIFLAYALMDIVLWLPILGSIPGFFLSFFPGGFSGNLVWLPAFFIFSLSIPRAPLSRAFFCSIVAVLGKVVHFEIAYLASYSNLVFLILSESPTSIPTAIAQAFFILAGGFLTRSFFFVCVSALIIWRSVFYPICASNYWKKFRGGEFLLILLAVGLAGVARYSFIFAEEGGQIFGRIWGGDDEERWGVVQEGVVTILGWFGVEGVEGVAGEWEGMEDGIVRLVDQWLDAGEGLVVGAVELLGKGCWMVA